VPLVKSDVDVTCPFPQLKIPYPYTHKFMKPAVHVTHVKDVETADKDTVTAVGTLTLALWTHELQAVQDVSGTRGAAVFPRWRSLLQLLASAEWMHLRETLGRPLQLKMQATRDVGGCDVRVCPWYPKYTTAAHLACIAQASQMVDKVMGRGHTDHDHAASGEEDDDNDADTSLMDTILSWVEDDYRVYHGSAAKEDLTDTCIVADIVLVTSGC
jgi:hypothetical protein